MYMPKERDQVATPAALDTPAQSATSNASLRGMSYADQQAARSPNTGGGGDSVAEWSAKVSELNVKQRAVVQALMRADDVPVETLAAAMKARWWAEDLATRLSSPGFQRWARTTQAVGVLATLASAVSAGVSGDYVKAMDSVANGLTHLAMGASPWTAALDMALTSFFGADWPSRYYRLFEVDPERYDAVMKARSKNSGLNVGNHRRR